MIPRLLRLANCSRRKVHYFHSSGSPCLVISAGMPRSASTWLYNAARLLLQHRVGKNGLSCGWIGDREGLPTKNTVLLKVHDFDASLASNANMILYSFRDLRDALASARRIFGVTPTLELARQFIANDRHWRQNSHFILRYETMMERPVETICQLAEILGIDQVNYHDLHQELRKLKHEDDGPRKEGYHAENLLHKGHITDGRHGSWQGWLEPKFLEALEVEFRDWFEANGYMEPRSSYQRAA